MNHDKRDIDDILNEYFSCPVPDEEIDAAGERVLQRIRAAAFKLTDGREIVGTAALRPFDQLVLTAVQLLRGEGDSVRIAGKVEELSSKRAMLGSVYLALDRLERKGLVSSRKGDAAQRFFSATADGERVLAEAAERESSDPLGDFA